MTAPRPLAEEVAVALSFDGSTEAVLMATPQDLEDLAVGFAVTEGIAEPSEIASIEPVDGLLGIDVQVWLVDGAGTRLGARRRQRVGPVGCGLCGIDSLAQARRALPRLETRHALDDREVVAAMHALDGHQPLRALTGATHAAALWRRGQGIVATREDVGRHNALDKLVGAMARQGLPAEGAAIVMSSRLSLDLVQKAALAGVGVLIGAGAPTTAAVDAAAEAGITLHAPVRVPRAAPSV